MMVEYRMDDRGSIHHDMQTCPQTTVASCPIQSVEHSIPKPREVIGGTETKSSYQAIVCQPRVLAVPRTVKGGLTKVGNQTKSLKYSEKKSFVLSI
jgi:hypothetical protein